ncbi:carboxypeptidase regulatory-like domain-containing protein [bacterium]|nr:MAG: carboxypeptidase regulatory-like domain-containing protein [bacterium]
MKITRIVLPLLVLLSAVPTLAVPLSVSVVDDKGKPIAGADVQLESFGKTPRGFVLNQTGEQGTTSFDFEPIPNAIYGDFAGRIFVKKNGYAIGSGQLFFKKPNLRIELGPPAKISGKVLDPEGKPIQGATIAYLASQKAGGESDMLYDGPLLPKVTTRSTADGTWQLPDVPTDSQVYVSIKAPERVSVRTQILAGSSADTILQPGAQIKGRVLGLDGKPLAGIHVGAQGTTNGNSSSGSSAKTEADGTFTLDGLATGTYNISFYSEEEEPPFVIAASEAISATIGAPLQLPDAHAVAGIMIGGHVLDSVSKAPVPGASVGVYGGVHPASSATVASASTDEKGFWKMRTLPGQSKIYLMGIPREFKRDQNTRELVLAPTDNLNLDFDIERLPTLSGRLVDENGKGIKASVGINQGYERNYFASSDEKGDFTAYGPTVGDWKLTTEGEWELAGPARITIEPNKPLEIRLRHAQISSLELGIYDDYDAAVEGAKVLVNITTDDGSMTQRELISDKMGRAHMEGLRADQKVTVVSIKKPGYDTTPLPKLDHIGRLWSGNLTLLKRNGRAAGQVFGLNGEAAPNVLVSGGGVDARADDKGQFELAPLPRGINAVFAWQGTGFVLSQSDKTRLELKPQSLEPTDPAKAKTILEAILEQTRDNKNYGSFSLEFEIGTPDQLFRIFKQRPEKYAFDTLLSRFGSDESISTGRWLELIQSEKQPADRLYDTSQWLLLGRPLEANEESRAFFKSLQSDVAQVETKIKDDNNWQIVEGMAAAAAFSEIIDDSQAADSLLERVRLFAEKAYGRESSRTLANMGAIVAVTPRLLNNMAAFIDPAKGWQAYLLRSGAPKLARLNGLDAAKPFIERLKATPQPKGDGDEDIPSIEWLFYEATFESIKAAGKTNPSLALELAKALPVTTHYGNYDVRDRALCEAAFSQLPEVAQTLWRDSLPRLQPDKAMSFLVRIMKIDEPFAREFYETFARNMDALPISDPASFMRGATANPAAFAFYESRFNPARARFRLERAFAIAQSQPTGNSDVASYARAMAIFDANRAIGWTANAKGAIGDSTGNFETRRRIAQWLVLSEQARQSAEFSSNY